MPVRAPAVRVVVGRLDRDEVQAAVAHARLGGQARGQLAHRRHRALQHGALEAVLVIEMHVHRRDHQVVVRVLALGEALGEIARVVVVHIGQARDALAARGVLLRVAIEVAADQVTHGLAAVLVAALRDEPVELPGEVVVERNGDALHGVSLLHTAPTMRAAAALLIALLLAFVISPPRIGSMVWLGALHDAGHVLTFAAIAVLLCAIARPRGAGFAVILGLLLLFGAGTELAQGASGGDPSIGDVGRDLLGGVAGMLGWVGMRPRRPGLLAAAALAIVAGLAPLALTGWAYAQRARQPQVVWDAGRATWSVFIETPRTGRLAHLPDPSRLRFTAESDSYAGVVVREPPPDWRGYATLVVRAVNPGSAPIALNLRIDDQPRDTEYEDRFNRERIVPPRTRLQWRVPVAEIEHGPVGRLLDLSHVTRVVIFLSPGSRGEAFDLESLRLEPGP